MFSHSSSLLKGPFRRRLSTVNITSGQRPRRLWDMHLPEKNWRFVPRGLSLVRRDETRPNETGIPDENLPEPWTCDWRAWGLLPSWLNAPGGLQCRLIHKFNIGLYDSMRHCYVAPLMFRSTQSTSGTTVFHARGTNGASFYLYDEPSDGVYRFEHDFPLQRGTAAEFMETANWNKMEYLGALGGASSVMESRPTPVKLGSDSCKWLRLRDLGQSEHTLWKYEPRVLRDAYAQRRATVKAAAHRCFFIPDTQLPEPWTCNWEDWHGWDSRIPLFEEVGMLFNIPRPLNAIMFDDETTLFESRGVFYLFSVTGTSEFTPKMYRFGGCYSSVEDFIENGDWNDMKRLEHSPLGDPGISVNSHDAPSARGSGTGFRTAANQPYQKRTLWDMGHSKDSWGYEARIFRPEEAANVKKEFPEWGSIPDDQLPEPWSCNWARWGEWFGFQDDLDDVYGMANLRPVMFIPYMYDRGPMILSHEGIYYLLGETEDATLMRFEGTYASDQDFVENGDWNRTETVEPFQWEEIEEVDQDVGSDKGNDAFDKGCKL